MASTGGMAIAVRTLLGGVFNLQVEPDTQIRQVKALLAVLQDVPAAQQSLVFRGRELRDGETLQEAGVGHGGALRLVLRTTTALTALVATPPTPAQRFYEDDDIEPHFEVIDVTGLSDSEREELINLIFDQGSRRFVLCRDGEYLSVLHLLPSSRDASWSPMVISPPPGAAASGAHAPTPFHQDGASLTFNGAADDDGYNDDDYSDEVDMETNGGGFVHGSAADATTDHSAGNDHLAAYTEYSRLSRASSHNTPDLYSGSNDGNEDCTEGDEADCADVALAAYLAQRDATQRLWENMRHRTRMADLRARINESKARREQRRRPARLPIAPPSHAAETGRSQAATEATAAMPATAATAATEATRITLAAYGTHATHAAHATDGTSSALPALHLQHARPLPPLRREASADANQVMLTTERESETPLPSLDSRPRAPVYTPCPSRGFAPMQAAEARWHMSAGSDASSDSLPQTHTHVGAGTGTGLTSGRESSGSSCVATPLPADSCVAHALTTPPHCENDLPLETEASLSLPPAPSVTLSAALAEARFGSPGRRTAGFTPTHVLTGLPLEGFRPSPEPMASDLDLDVPYPHPHPPALDATALLSRQGKRSVQQQPTGSASASSSFTRRLSASRTQDLRTERQRAARVRRREVEAVAALRAREGGAGDAAPRPRLHSGRALAQSQSSHSLLPPLLSVRGQRPLPMPPTAQHSGSGEASSRRASLRARGGLPAPDAAPAPAPTPARQPLGQREDSSRQCQPSSKPVRRMGAGVHLPGLASGTALADATAGYGSTRRNSSGHSNRRDRNGQDRDDGHAGSQKRSGRQGSASSSTAHRVMPIPPSSTDTATAAAPYLAAARAVGSGSTRETRRLAPRPPREPLVPRETGSAGQRHRRHRRRQTGDNSGADQHMTTHVAVPQADTGAAALPTLPATPPPAIRKRARCGWCQRKLKFGAQYGCRCDLSFCGACRYPEEHACTYDHKSEGRKLLQAASPAIHAAKLPKI